jgi:formylglycine-generating enzyme required for sulfatase activity
MRNRAQLFFTAIALMLGGTVAWQRTAGEAVHTAIVNDAEFTNSIGMKLVRIPAGEFEMGSAASETDREPQEIPHKVRISRPFYMAAYEVTQAEYAKLMDPNTLSNFHRGNGGSPEHPMENVLWVEAEEFCKKLTALDAEKRANRTYRLPTEAEWEYACRGGTNTAFHFGDSLSSTQANFDGNYPFGNASKGPYRRKTVRIGSYAPNAFGLYDMHGNVAEWCADWFDPDYYEHSPETDPKGPPAGVLPDDYDNFFLVARGGSWLDDSRACRSAYRMRAMHRNRYWIIGFRVACEIAGK